MSDAFRKVRPGEPVRVAARAWNRIIDQVTTKPRFDGNTSAWPQTNFRVRCRNNTSTGISRWGVLQIDNILEAPTGVGSQFEQWPGVIGITPGVSLATGVAYVVAVEPIPAGGIGHAAIDGVVQAKVEVVSESHGYAKPKTGEVGYLETTDSGPFKIIWKGATGPANPTGVTGPTKPWALVSFVGGGSSAPSHLGSYNTNGTQWEKGQSVNVHEYEIQVAEDGTKSVVPRYSNGIPVTTSVLNLFVTIPPNYDRVRYCAYTPINGVNVLIVAEC